MALADAWSGRVPGWAAKAAVHPEAAPATDATRGEAVRSIEAASKASIRGFMCSHYYPVVEKIKVNDFEWRNEDFQR